MVALGQRAPPAVPALARVPVPLGSDYGMPAATLRVDCPVHGMKSVRPTQEEWDEYLEVKEGR